MTCLSKLTLSTLRMPHTMRNYKSCRVTLSFNHYNIIYNILTLRKPFYDWMVSTFVKKSRVLLNPSKILITIYKIHFYILQVSNSTKKSFDNKHLTLTCMSCKARLLITFGQLLIKYGLARLLQTTNKGIWAIQ